MKVFLILLVLILSCLKQSFSIKISPISINNKTFEIVTKLENIIPNFAFYKHAHLLIGDNDDYWMNDISDAFMKQWHNLRNTIKLNVENREFYNHWDSMG